MVRHLAPLSLAFIVFLLAVGPALGVGADHPAGPVAFSDRHPAGLADLVNRRDRVHGYWVNFEDVFFHRGDTAALNIFLEAYARLPKARLKVVLHPGSLKVRSPWDQADRELAADWRFYGSLLPPDFPKNPNPDGFYHTQVDVYLGGRLKLADLKVPAGVSVESSGEIERFVSEHTKKQ